MEYKFGVCCCELDITDEVEDLQIFDTYDEAFDSYIKRLNIKDNPRWIEPYIWIVWIRKSDNKIEQFEQLSWKTKCKLIDIKE